jgi:hypothetical protein
MARALKTQRNRSSVTAFLDAVTDDARRKDCRTVAALMQDVTGEKPAMWGTSMVGFGSYHYKYASGQEGDWPLVGFSPRKDSLTLYIMPGFHEYTELLGRLGKHKKGVSCLYIKSLDDVDLPTLKTLVRQSVRHMKRMVKERSGR